MRTVTAGFRTQMARQRLDVSRRFIYNAVDRSSYPKNYGTITLDATKIVSGKFSIDLINSDQLWSNMFLLPNLANLRQTATVELGLQVSGATEWVTFFTGILDEDHFIRDYANCSIRDKMMLMLEKKVGSTEVPVDYWSGFHPGTGGYNPADLVWDLLVTHGQMSNIAGVANPDIDYALWQNWHTDLAAVSLEIVANLTGETIAHVLSKIAKLTNSVIFVRGDGKFVFFRYVPPLAVYLTFDDNNTHLQEVKHTFDYLVNDVFCEWGYTPGGAWNVGGPENTFNNQSKTDYWEVITREEDIAIWHRTQASAKEFCNRQIDRYKDPLEVCYFESGVMGYLSEPGDLIYLTFNFFSYSAALFEVRRVDFNLNTGKVRIEAVNTLTWSMGAFILDDLVLGNLDKDFNPLY